MQDDYIVTVPLTGKSDVERYEEIESVLAEFRDEKRTGMICEPVRGKRYFLKGEEVTRSSYLKSHDTIGLRRMELEEIQSVAE